MFGKITRRLRYISDRILVRTKPMGSMNQIHWGMEIAETIFEDGDSRKERHRKLGLLAGGNYPKNGEDLWCYLPPGMASIVIRRSFDPYDSELSKAGIRDWLWHHVVFDDNGNIIAIHDHGEILDVKDGWTCEAEWFSRVRLNSNV